MGGEIIRFMVALHIVMASLLYCYFTVSKLPKGKLRLLSLLPVFCLFAVLPFCFSSVLFTSSVALFVTWLTTFNLLLFSFDLGPLASDPPLSFPLFASIAFFPTRIKYNRTAPCGQNLRKHHRYSNVVPQEPPPKWPLTLQVKVTKLAILVWCNSHFDPVPPIAKASINCVIMYFYLDMVMSVANAFVQSAFGVEVKRPFDQPFLPSSLQNLWGRRWNLLVSETLHDTIYKPVRYKLGGPRWAEVITVFVVSGLMHELLLYYIIRVTPTWEATWFFVIQGVCVAVEIELKRKLGKKWGLHWMVSGALTIAFVMANVNWLLFPLILRMDMHMLSSHGT